MSLDPKIVEAVRMVVEDLSQPPALARRLIAWLEAAAGGSEDMNDGSTADRHLELIYEAVAPAGEGTGEGPGTMDAV